MFETSNYNAFVYNAHVMISDQRYEIADKYSQVPVQTFQAFYLPLELLDVSAPTIIASNAIKESFESMFDSNSTDGVRERQDLK